MTHTLSGTRPRWEEGAEAKKKRNQGTTVGKKNSDQSKTGTSWRVSEMYAAKSEQVI